MTAPKSTAAHRPSGEAPSGGGPNTPAPAQAPLGTDAALSTASGAGAGLLREAAALMRERARMCETDPSATWLVWHDLTGVAGADGFITVGDDAEEGEDCNPVAKCYTPNLASHIASWHPAVALAVADWLMDAAARLTLSRALVDDGEERRALAVARAYLGESA